jgi:hypothetical protein
MRQEQELTTDTALPSDEQFILTAEEIDIFKLPADPDINRDEKGKQFTVGDLQGNAIKLLYILFVHGVATGLCAEEYRELVEIYSAKLTKESAHRFNEILQKITIDPECSIRFIGDLLSDRGVEGCGSNDYLTLLVLQIIRGRFEVTFSNHDALFIINFEQKKRFETSGMPEFFVRSMLNLQTSIDEGVVSRKAINTIVKETYLPALRLLSYSMNIAGDFLNLFSHAPIDIAMIRDIALLLGVSLDETNPDMLGSSIDNINQQFKAFIDARQVHQLYQYEAIQLVANNRDYERLDRYEHHPDFGYKLCYVHGHDDTAAESTFCYSLDNPLGQPGRSTGMYLCYISQDVPPIARFGLPLTTPSATVTKPERPSPSPDHDDNPTNDADGTELSNYKCIESSIDKHDELAFEVVKILFTEINYHFKTPEDYIRLIKKDETMLLLRVALELDDMSRIRLFLPVQLHYATDSEKLNRTVIEYFFNTSEDLDTMMLKILALENLGFHCPTGILCTAMNRKLPSKDIKFLYETFLADPEHPVDNEIFLRDALIGFHADTLKFLLKEHDLSEEDVDKILSKWPDLCSASEKNLRKSFLYISILSLLEEEKNELVKQQLGLFSHPASTRDRITLLKRVVRCLKDDSSLAYADFIQMNKNFDDLALEHVMHIEAPPVSEQKPLD